MKVVLARGPEMLETHYPEVASLFAACFDRPLCRSVWEQFYLSSPYGPSVGVLGFDGEALVGFYGLVPQRLFGPAGGSLDYMLGITLMLHPSRRAGGAFLELVGAAMEAARAEAASFVMGFPNEQSYRPLARLFRWQTLVETTFCQITVKGESPPPESVAEISPVDAFPTGLAWSVPYGDAPYIRWRSARNDYRSASLGDGMRVAYKVMEPATLDVVDAVRTAPGADGVESLEYLARASGCRRVLLTAYHARLVGVAEEALEPVGDYTLRLCVLSFIGRLPEIHLSLLMSDVF